MEQNNDDRISRRDIVTAAGVGLASAATPVSAAQSDPTTASALRDPTTKYPKPPFPGQSQPWPGLASRMNPRPDHGETSYRGGGRLLGRKALITGGDSGMGRAAAMTPCAASGASTYWSATPVANRPTPPSSTSRPSNLIGR